MKKIWFEFLIALIPVLLLWVAPMYLPMFFVIWYWIGEGATEGFTWASPYRRKNNIIIRPGKHDANNVLAKGRWSYHTWRVVGEDLGIIGAIISYGLFTNISTGFLPWLIDFIGANLIGIFMYERIFNHISYNNLWPHKKNWDCLNGLIDIPRSPLQDIGILLLGLGLILL